MPISDAVKPETGSGIGHIGLLFLVVAAGVFLAFSLLIDLACFLPNSKGLVHFICCGICRRKSNAEGKKKPVGCGCSNENVSYLYISWQLIFRPKEHSPSYDASSKSSDPDESSPMMWHRLTCRSLLFVYTLRVPNSRNVVVLIFFVDLLFIESFQRSSCQV